MINIGWPQGILLALVIVKFFIVVCLDGQDRRPHDSGGTIVKLSALVALLFWGGFFS